MEAELTRHPGKRAARAAAAALAVAFLLVATSDEASASRPPDATEGAAIAALIGITPDCAEISVSTIDPTWAVLHSAINPACQGGNGYVIAHFEGSWYINDQGSDQTCPMEDIDVFIAADLGLCPPVSRRPYFVFYSLSDPSSVRLGIRPKNFLPLQGTKGIYRKIHWSSWGQRRAFGRGVYYFQHTGLKARIRFRIKLYRVRECPNGVRIFTRRKIRGIRPSGTSWFRTDARRTRFGSCSENQTSPFL